MEDVNTDINAETNAYTEVNVEHSGDITGVNIKNTEKDKEVNTTKKEINCDINMGQNMDSDYVKVNLSENDENDEKAEEYNELHITEEGKDSAPLIEANMDIIKTECKQNCDTVTQESSCVDENELTKAENSDSGGNGNTETCVDNMEQSNSKDSIVNGDTSIKEITDLCNANNLENLTTFESDESKTEGIENKDTDDKNLEHNSEMEIANIPKPEENLSASSKTGETSLEEGADTGFTNCDTKEDATDTRTADNADLKATEATETNSEREMANMPKPEENLNASSKTAETSLEEDADTGVTNCDTKEDATDTRTADDADQKVTEATETQCRTEENVDLNSIASVSKESETAVDSSEKVEGMNCLEITEKDIDINHVDPTTELEKEGNSSLDLKTSDKIADVVAAKEKLESEIMTLQQELRSAHTTIRTTQGHLRNQQVKNNQIVMTLKFELYKSQAALKQQKLKSDKQMSDVVSHLVLLEGQLRKEQCRMKNEMKHKNEEIANQKKEILKLKNQNEQLLNAIKEICAKGGMNGYMRENRRKHSTNSPDTVENGGKNTKDKKEHKSQLGSVKDKFSWKNRSSLELNSFNLEKYLIKNDRMCSSQEDLKNVGKDKGKSNPNGIHGDKDSRLSHGHAEDPWVRHKDESHGQPINGISGRSPKSSQNYFSELDSARQEMTKSVSDSSQISANSSGVYSLSDHDTFHHDNSLTNGHHGNSCHDDDEDDRYFSFSSTDINTVIDEEDVIGPIISHSGQMISMGSMPTLAHRHDDSSQWLYPAKNRPHSLSSVDLAAIQKQAQTLAHLQGPHSPEEELSTPPPSPSYNQSKNELTPFQTFKTMFKRKGSKNKGNKKRSVSLSQTTNKEYSEAVKKHFQKYNMS